MKCKDCACSDVCYYKAFNDVRAVKRRDDVEKGCKSFVHRDSIKVDAVEVVRCEKCVHCINDEEEPGMCKCVESAEYESESGLWLGFVEYHTPDFFCAFGERKDND
jgi:hypothetical protein